MTDTFQVPEIAAVPAFPEPEAPAPVVDHLFYDLNELEGRDHLIFLIENKLQLKHGVDFWCGVQLDPITEQPNSDPFLLSMPWPDELDHPSENQILEWVDEYQDEWQIARIEEKKREATATIDAEHARAMNELTGNATPEERDTWQAKALAAEAYIAGSATATQTAMLSTEANYLEQEIDDVVALIADKASAYQSLIGLASGIRRKGHQQIASATSIEQIEQVISDLDKEVNNAIDQWKRSSSS